MVSGHGRHFLSHGWHGHSGHIAAGAGIDDRHRIGGHLLLVLLFSLWNLRKSDSVAHQLFQLWIRVCIFFAIGPISSHEKSGNAEKVWRTAGEHCRI